MDTAALENMNSVTKRRWTIEEEEVLRRYYPLPKALPVDKLAAFLGRSVVSVIRKLSNMGLRRNV